MIFFAGNVSAQENYNTLIFEGNNDFDRKNYDAAASKYLKAIGENNKDFTAHYNLGNALYKSKKFEEAKAEFEKAQDLSKNFADKAAALHNLGNSYMQTNNAEKAAEFYKKSLKQDPYNEATRKNYEIAKLKEKENQQEKNQDKSGGGGGKGNKKDQQEGEGDKKQKSGGNGDEQKGNGDGENPDKNQNPRNSMPKELQDALLNRVANKERETAKRILNKGSYSVPESNAKDW
ncbi:tetratricopeptide repeat protein [Chryseobacterium sp.]|uniref:tetratricopeptide repeat protein n=1 Tax=Chryseobacterium sp. TaxID=1871047 RepID=UPI001E43AD81|nr:tetratricopeptide repeat protein [Chryseobacterium sp.]